MHTDKQQQQKSDWGKSGWSGGGSIAKPQTGGGGEYYPTPPLVPPLIPRSPLCHTYSHLLFSTSLVFEVSVTGGSSFLFSLYFFSCFFTCFFLHAIISQNPPVNVFPFFPFTQNYVLICERDTFQYFIAPTFRGKGLISSEIQKINTFQTY